MKDGGRRWQLDLAAVVLTGVAVMTADVTYRHFFDEPCEPTLCGRVSDLIADFTIAGGHYHARSQPFHTTDLMLSKFSERLQMWRIRKRPFPATIEELMGGTLDAPLDGWGNAFVYERSEASVRVVSYGADGQPGGTCEDTDRAIEVTR